MVELLLVRFGVKVYLEIVDMLRNTSVGWIKKLKPSSDEQHHCRETTARK